MPHKDAWNLFPHLQHTHGDVLRYPDCGEAPPNDSSAWVLIESLCLSSLMESLGGSAGESVVWAPKPSIGDDLSMVCGGV